jgi:hypothetical protein
LKTFQELADNQEQQSFVNGHDFSRANKADQINGALAPAGNLILHPFLV